MGQVWAVFSDGSAREVILNSVSPDDAQDLVLKPVGIDNPQVRTAGEKALRAAFQTLGGKGLLPGKNLAYCYEFSGNDPVIQSSASLAFSLKLVQKLARLPMAMAATGIVPNSSASAGVEKITHINEKLRAGIAKLGPGDLFVYPKDNHDDIRPDMLGLAAEKGVGLVPVQTVAEMIDALLQTDTATTPPVAKTASPAGARKSFFRPLAGILILLLALAGIWHFVDTYLTQKVDNAPIPVLSPEISATTASNDSAAGGQPEGSQTGGGEAQGPENQLGQIAIDLKGDDPALIRALTNALAVKLRHAGFRTDTQKFSAILTGTARIADYRKIPLQPYAPDNAVIVHMRLVLEDARVVLKDGKKYPLGNYSAKAQGPLDQEARIIESSSRKLVDQITSRRDLAELKKML